jgi:hypothetical protein
MLRRTASSSFGPNGRLTRDDQSRGQSIGQGLKTGRSGASWPVAPKVIVANHPTNAGRQANNDVVPQTTRAESMKVSPAPMVLAA